MRVEVNGTTLYFDVDGAGVVAEGWIMRERPTVVLLHGGPGFDHASFKPVYSRLAAIAQVVYVDHRGNGRSDGHDDPSSWTFDIWADDVRGLCDTLGIERPIVLGWSFGGSVAQRYASRYPDHPAKLILQSTAARFDRERIVEGFRTEGGDDAAAAAHAYFADPSPDTTPAFLTHCVPAYSPAPLDFARVTRTVANLAIGDYFYRDLAFDFTRELAAVTCPTLVLAGAHDPITSLAAADEIVASLTNADVMLEVFEHSGHFISDTEPERLFAVLESFIDS